MKYGKRQTNPEKWNGPRFRELPPMAKLLYLTENCDWAKPQTNKQGIVMAICSITPPSVRHWGGFRYELLLYSEEICLYQQKNILNHTVGYEVFRIKHRPDRYIGDRFIRASMRFPSDEDFGSWAWSYYSLDGAIAKVISLIKKRGA
ncbi:MAG: hypothetical protein O2951_18730 [Bacteroidetes bacterium]|nr:hypothetical protein [Bacteroidota bacterium]